MERLVVVLLLIVLAVGVLGFYLDWFNLSSDTQGDRTDIRLTIDKDKMKADTATAKEKLKDLPGEAKETGSEITDKIKEEVRDVQNQQTVTGKIKDIESGDNRLVITVDGKDMSFENVSAAKLRVSDKDAKLSDLKAGDEVTVTFKVEGGKNIATAVTRK